VDPVICCATLECFDATWECAVCVSSRSCKAETIVDRISGFALLQAFRVTLTFPSQENSNRAGAAEPTDCNSLDCAEFFLYAGVCRKEGSAASTFREETFCVRRKFSKGFNAIGKDSKVSLSKFRYKKKIANEGANRQEAKKQESTTIKGESTY
jgi:hypothetical protein